MPNLFIAKEWLEHSGKNLETAILLYKADHYTDVIAIDIQQSIEKALKAVYAFYHTKIPRTHALPLLFNFVIQHIEFIDISIDDIIRISDYYETDRYPGPRYFIPSKEEIGESLIIAENIYNSISKHISIR